VIAQRERERERRSLGFSLMTSHGGEAAEIATRRCSTEAVGGASMGRWFQTRGGEIGVGMGVVDNEGALVMPFIWS
jgi:hypothetical protein